METFEIKLTLPRTLTRKIAGHTFTLELDKAPEASLAWMLAYGSRGLNDAANAAAKTVRDGGGEWLLADSRRYVDSFMDGTIAERSRREAGASTVDPVMVEARKLATADICAAIGGLKWKEAAEHPKGAKYFKVTDKGNVTMVTSAVDEFIARNDAKANYMARAKAIADARGADVEIDL